MLVQQSGQGVRVLLRHASEPLGIHDLRVLLFLHLAAQLVDRPVEGLLQGDRLPVLATQVLLLHHPVCQLKRNLFRVRVVIAILRLWVQQHPALLLHLSALRAGLLNLLQLDPPPALLLLHRLRILLTHQLPSHLFAGQSRPPASNPADLLDNLGLRLHLGFFLPWFHSCLLWPLPGYRPNGFVLPRVLHKHWRGLREDDFLLLHLLLHLLHLLLHLLHLHHLLLSVVL